MSAKTEYYIMMHHLWRYAEQDKNLGKYNLDLAWSYFEAIENNKGQAPADGANMTANGKKIVEYMKANPTYDNLFLASDIGKGLGMTSQSVSGSMRKLITEGYVVKGKYGTLTTYSLAPQTE